MKAVIFTYAPDYGKAMIAAAALARCGVESVIALDQAEAVPWPGDHRVVITTFPRRANLNYRECSIGILRLIAELGADDPNGFVIKCDSDTILLSTEWMENETMDVSGVGVALNDFPLYGCLYAVRPRAVPAIIAEIESREVEGKWKGMHPGEDLILGTVARSLGILKSWDYHTRGCPFRFWQYEEERCTAGAMVERFQVCSLQPDFRKEISRAEATRQIPAIEMHMAAVLAAARRLRP